MNERFEEFLKTGSITFKTGCTNSDGKFVEKTYENMMRESLDIKEELNLQGDYEFITTTTPEHLFGFSFYQMFPYVCGFRINPDRINYPEDINAENAVLVTTPSFLEAMRKHNVSPKIKPKIIITAGAKLEDNTFEYALSISDKVVEIYGSTEAGIIAYRTNFRNKELKLFKGIKILETNENFTKLETKYSKENIVIIDDRIEVSGEYIRFIGRNGRVLKIQEKRILSDSYENEIKKSEYIKEAYCFEFKGKLASLCVLSDKGIDFLINKDKISLVKTLKKDLNKVFDILPQRWKFLDEIPTKTNGKIDKDVIDEIFNMNLSLPLIINRKISPEYAHFKLCFLNNSSFFKGHFEGMPILPGVAQLFFANRFCKIAFGTDCSCGQLRKIKFSRIIRPNQIVTLELKKNASNVEYKYFDDQTYSSGVLPIINHLEEKNGTI